MNGDGISDVLITELHADVNAYNNGRVHLLLGRDGGWDDKRIGGC